MWRNGWRMKERQRSRATKFHYEAEKKKKKELGVMTMQHLLTSLCCGDTSEALLAHNIIWVLSKSTDLSPFVLACPRMKRIYNVLHSCLSKQLTKYTKLGAVFHSSWYQRPLFRIGTLQTPTLLLGVWNVQ